MGTSKSILVTVVLTCIVLFYGQLRADDRWVKIHIRDEGFYKLTGEDLENIGVNFAGLAPANLSMYNNGG